MIDAIWPEGAWYVVNFTARVVIFTILVRKHGWKAGLMAYAYALLAHISPEL